MTLAAVLGISSGICLADEGCPRQLVRPQDELWLVETRHLSCDLAPEEYLSQLRVWKFASSSKWETASAAALLGAEPMRTIVWVHGNRVDRDLASRRGARAYRALVEKHGDEAPARFIIWSWPAAQIRGQLKDIRVKAQRSDQEGLGLARFLGAFSPEVPVGLVGFSFGARVITGALDELGENRQETPGLGEQLSPARQVRAVLLAAALDDDWLLPGYLHGQALSQVDYLLALNNSCDPALKRYHWTSCQRCSEALGYWGLAGGDALGAEAIRYEQTDVAGEIGPEHDSELYLANPFIMGLAWQALTEGRGVEPLAKLSPAEAEAVK